MWLRLNEDTRKQLIDKGKKSKNYKVDRTKGKNRFARRVHSKVAGTVKDFNNIDMNKLFKQGILSVFISVKGETDDYKVGISFGDFCEILRSQLKEGEEVSIRHYVKAIMIGINKADVYVRCDCDDFKYRIAYWSTQGRTIMGQGENRPSNITNPNNDLGNGCKHILLVLNNTVWVMKIASVINGYVQYIKNNYENQYAKVIYPAIYGKEYTEPTQGRFDDEERADNLIDTEDEIGKSVKFNKERTQFKKGNKQGIRFARSSKDPDQIDLVFDD